MLDDGPSESWEPFHELSCSGTGSVNLVILVVETLFNGENFHIIEEDFPESIICILLKEIFGFDHSLLLQLWSQKMVCAALISFQSKILPEQPGHSSL